MTSVAICDLDPDLKELLNKFRFRKEKNIAAIIMKIDKKTKTVVLDEEFEDTSIDEVQAEVAQQQPRYIALSYVLTSSDGRVSYPLIFIFLSPQGCSPELSMLYAGSKSTVVNEGQFTKELELRNPEDLTEETILAMFKK